jgi:hypothetical protein
MDKAKAGRLLSKFLNRIAEEENECLIIDGEDRMVTKAEALARLVWRMALGYKETVADSKGVKEVVHLPDKGMIEVVFDRIEGKAAAIVDDTRTKGLADKLSDESRQRISSAGGLNG